MARDVSSYDQYLLDMGERRGEKKGEKKGEKRGRKEGKLEGKLEGLTEGIAAAKAQGKHLGRPAVSFPENWDEVYMHWKKREITAKRAMELTGTKRTSFYKLARMAER